MNSKQEKSISKFISLVLRHEPDRIGISLDPAGWVAVDELLAGLARHGHAITRAELEQIVRSSDKQRFALSNDGNRIRANQGHSVEIDLGYEPQTPPEWLIHGTAAALPTEVDRAGLRPAIGGRSRPAVRSRAGARERGRRDIGAPPRFAAQWLLCP